MCAKPRQWKRLVRFAQQSATRASILEEGWQQCRGLMHRCLVGVGAFSEVVAIDAGQALHVCAACQRTFKTHQAWAVHAFKLHGRVRPAGELVDSAACPICLRVYASNVQLCRHVEHSRTCRDSLIAQGFRCTPQPGKGCVRADVGADFLGAVRQGLGCGGLRPFRGSCCFRLLHAPCPRGVCDLLEGYRQTLCADCVSFHALDQLATQWYRHICSDALDEYDVHTSATHAVAWVEQHLTVSWLCPNVTSGGYHGPTFRRSAERLAFLDFSEVCPEPPADVTLRQGFLLCHGQQVQDFVREGGLPSRILSLQEVFDTADWCQAVSTAIEQGVQGLFVFWLIGVPVNALTPRGPLKLKQYKPFRSWSVVIQDVALLCLQLWARSLGFAAVFAFLDPVAAATFRQLPGMQVLCNGSKCVLHNVPEASVPQRMYHFVAN